MENNFKMIAKTFFGFEEILAKELQQLGAQDVEIVDTRFGPIPIVIRRRRCAAPRDRPRQEESIRVLIWKPVE